MLRLLHPILLILCFSISSSAWAVEKEQEEIYVPFNGFYAGGSLGTSFANTHDQFTSAAIARLAGVATTSIPVGLKSDRVKTSWIGALFAGYGRNWERVYLGGELSVSAANYNMKNTNQLSPYFNLTGPLTFSAQTTANVTTQTKLSPVQFSAALRPGYLLTPSTLLYGRVGVAIARVSFNINAVATGRVDVDATGISIHGSYPANLSMSTSKQRAALQLGGGLEQSVNEQWSVRLDYVYINYGSLSINTNSLTNLNFTGVNVGSASLVVNNKVKITDQTVMLGAIYRFNA